MTQQITKENILKLKKLINLSGLSYPKASSIFFNNQSMFFYVLHLRLISSLKLFDSQHKIQRKINSSSVIDINSLISLYWELFGKDQQTVPQ
jgi:hypothetical protein